MIQDEFHRTRPDGSLWTPNQVWERDPPLCEVYGCDSKALPLCHPDATGVRCLECASFHRICGGHTNELLYMQIVFQFKDDDFVQVICPNEALVGRDISPTE